jgi:hypothetical protein
MANKKTTNFYCLMPRCLNFNIFTNILVKYDFYLQQLLFCFVPNELNVFIEFIIEFYWMSLIGYSVLDHQGFFSIMGIGIEHTKIG